MGEGGEAVVKWMLNSSDSIEPLKGKNDLDTVIYTFVSQDELPLWALVRSNEGWWSISITLFQTLTLHSLHYVSSESIRHAVPKLSIHEYLFVYQISLFRFLCDFTPLLYLNVIQILLSWTCLQLNSQLCHAESPWLSKQKLTASMQEFKPIPELKTARTANISQF